MTNPSGLKPLGRAVLVKPYLIEERTSGGILLPDQVRKRDQTAEQRAVVVEVGPNCWRDEPQPRARVGDKILFSKWAGYHAVGTLDDEDYRVVNDSDIFLQIVGEK